MTSPEVTQLLARASSGDRTALDRLMPIVYDELKGIAEGHQRREADWHTLGATELLHEAYLKLIVLDRIDWQDRAHFFAMASRLMRQVLLREGERRNAKKRGGGVAASPLEASGEEGGLAGGGPSVETLLSLDDALERLDGVDERYVRVVECRYVAGLSIEETASALGVSPATVKRDWTFARAWLARELSP